MSKFAKIVLFFICIPFALNAGKGYGFRVYLKDKGASEYNVDQPEQFLSKEALERRVRQGIEITFSDLPIAQSYLDTLILAGGKPIVQSKWLCTVVVSMEDSITIQRVEQLAIVDSVKWIWSGKKEQRPEIDIDTSLLITLNKPLDSYYGYATEQIKMLNGVKLHDSGYKGEGMTIAVIDAGFMNVDRIVAFDSLKLLGTRNMVDPGKSVFREDDHGTKVLSCLAANIPGIMVGTAPAANYWLIKSEDTLSEYPIEEDYWVAALEFADSVGVEVISSSLGYFTFDRDELNHHPSELDGNTSIASRAASIAADKGVLIFCSAGNEGANTWGKITFPADARNILTVGAITEKKEKSTFSSVGLTADYRMKPDVVALGTASCVIDYNGQIRLVNGTSFSTPIVAGLGICLWQALPQLSNKDIIKLIQQSSNLYKRPNIELGYGIPNMYKAYKWKRKHGKTR